MGSYLREFKIVRLFQSFKKIHSTHPVNCKRILQQKRFIHNSNFLFRLRDDDNNDSVPGAVAEKFKVFRDEDSRIILDVDEERQKYLENQIVEEEAEKPDEFVGINLERGVHGVFDIEDLVALLRREKAQDIFVASVPAEYKYVDYIVVINGHSKRHMLAMAEFIRKTYKRKRHDSDLIPKIEGENSADWIALDLGNIALHIFSKKARPIYDLDCLWSVGAAYDDQCNKPEDPVISLLQQHAIYLGSLESQQTKG